MISSKPRRPRRAPVPWRMCRTCHRKGTSSGFLKCSAHPVSAPGDCGQCGKRRPLVECHSYDFRRRPLKKTQLKRSNPKRRAREFARCYGSKERVEWVKAQRCAIGNRWCEAPTENAHIRNGGAGRKADASQVIPLCAFHHRRFHRFGASEFALFFGIDLNQLAADTEARWQEFQEKGE